MVVLSAAFLCAGLPAYATHTPEHATDEIWGVAAQAEQDMGEVVSGFEGQIAGMGTEGEVRSAEDQADDDIKAIWNAAKNMTDELANLYPGQLGPVGGAAKQQLQEARQTSRNLISALSDAWTPPTPTTTTQPPTNPGQGAGSPPPGSNNGAGGGPPVPPGSPSQNRPDPANQSQPDEPSESGPGNSPSSQPSPSPSPAQASEDATGSATFILATQTPDPPRAMGPEEARSIVGSRESGATERMAAVLDTVLPPAVVDLVLSPLLVLEILVRTTLEGGLTVIGPLSLLAICAFAIFVFDRSSKRSAFLG